MVVNTFRKRPQWLDEEVLLQNLLNILIDKVDRGVKPQVRVTAKIAPELYDYNHEDTRYLWGLVKTLDNEYQILTIKLQRAKAGQEAYDNAQLYFNIDQENLVRNWLNRPVFDPYLHLWQSAIEKHLGQFEGGGDVLLEHVIHHPEKTAEEIIQGFSKLADELSQPITLRALSARCFWGDSKFLDKREELISTLLPTRSKSILPRPILINVCIPSDFTEVLFVENQDSFLMLVAQVNNSERFEKTALVYSSGFRGSAMRVRQSGGAIFSHLKQLDPIAVAQFERWWFSEVEQPVPCYFWGDLDYAGMAILAALRKTFELMQAWRPGYEAMLSYGRAGTYHSLESAGKEKQNDPGETGCVYADQALLPLMRCNGQFVDQEVVDITET
jgi:Wadjet protein JetD, C-terminal